MTRNPYDLETPYDTRPRSHLNAPEYYFSLDGNPASCDTRVDSLGSSPSRCPITTLSADEALV